MVVVSDFNKNLADRRIWRKKRHGSPDLHAPIHLPLSTNGHQNLGGQRSDTEMKKRHGKSLRTRKRRDKPKTATKPVTLGHIVRDRHQIQSVRAKSRVVSLPRDGTEGTVEIRHEPRKAIRRVLLGRDQGKMQATGIRETEKGIFRTSEIAGELDIWFSQLGNKTLLSIKASILAF